MSGFLRRLAERSLGVERAARPIVPSFFADWRTGAESTWASTEPGLESEPEIEVESTAPPRRAAGREKPQATHRLPGSEADVPSAAPATPSPRPRPNRVSDLVERNESGEFEEILLARRAFQEAGGERPQPIRKQLEGAIAPPRTEAAVRARDVPELPAAPPTRRPEPAPEDAVAVPASVANDVVVPPIHVVRPSIGARPAVLAPAASPSMAIEGIVGPRRRATVEPQPPRGSTAPQLAAGTEERVVEISIGRIEVRAMPGPTVEPRTTRPAQPGLSLEAYLRGRGARA